MLFLIVGLPGVGKTTVATCLEHRLAATRITLDEVFPLLYPGGLPEADGDYSERQLAAMYAALGPIIYYLVKAGSKDIILEGTFRKQEQRLRVLSVMDSLSVPSQTIWVRAESEVVTLRIQRRFEAGLSHATPSAYLRIQKIFEEPTRAYHIDNTGLLNAVPDKVEEYLRSIGRGI